MARGKRRLFLVITILLMFFTVRFFGHLIDSKDNPHVSKESRQPRILKTGRKFINKGFALFLNTTTSKSVPSWKGSLLDPSFTLTSEVLTRNSTSWRNENGVCDWVTSDLVNATLKSPAGNTPIFVYTKDSDIWVSGNIIQHGMWEGDLVKMMYRFMTMYDDADFIDLGANVGVYGLTVAKMGRRVVLIDPLLGNVKRLCKSVRMGRFHNEVHIVHNAISDKRSKVSFGKYKHNVGGTFIKEITSADTEVAQAILLDDLLSIFNFTKVILKMDIERHETKALLGGERFFRTVDVIIVQIEWMSHRKDGKEIIEFLTRHHMKPYSPSVDGEPLNVHNFHTWPSDVVWKKI